MLLNVVAFLSQLSACVPAARQELGKAGGRHLQAGTQGRKIDGVSRLDADGSYPRMAV